MKQTNAERRAIIVVGASYGDEGKGFAAALAARSMPSPSLNVMINGGAQRGHTVDLPDGTRHVFHHFGSGSMFGAVSCADRDYIVNPALYLQEREELDALKRKQPALCTRLLISDRCRVSTLYDMMLNQMLEEARGGGRHGSCGLGIFETRTRYERCPDMPRWGDLIRMTYPEWETLCRRIRDVWIPQRMAEHHFEITPEWQAVLQSEDIIRRGWDELTAMQKFTELYTDWAAMATDWPTLIFETGQGLALDEDNMADYPYLTPSHTTSRVSAERIAALPGNTKARVLYVTRSYVTRHGAGPLPGECPVTEISPVIRDNTNVPNPWQHTLRYAPIRQELLLNRIRADLAASRQVLPGLSCGLLITHLNETGGEIFGDTDVQTLAGAFDSVLLSDKPWDVMGEE